MHKLEQLRLKLQISKTEMAQRLGISKSNYSMIIHGRHGISKKVALKVHEEFGVPIEDLLYPQVQTNATKQQKGHENGVDRKSSNTGATP
jgi:plasmid maintenance system antidote protein VapI